MLFPVRLLNSPIDLLLATADSLFKTVMVVCNASKNSSDVPEATSTSTGTDVATVQSATTAVDTTAVALSQLEPVAKFQGLAGNVNGADSPLRAPGMLHWTLNE